MNTLTREELASREKTLLAALLLSMWAPLATGIAVLLSRSTTQVADFIRRSVELIALFISWRVFRYLHRGKEPDSLQKDRLEHLVSFSTAVAMGVSGVVIIAVAFTRFPTFVPGGNVYPGLAIALLGLITNSWFWRRYASLNRKIYDRVIDTQRCLYRAKAVVDLCVIIALSAVAIAPLNPATRFIDLLGSVAVSIYLAWSSICTIRNNKR